MKRLSIIVFLEGGIERYEVVSNFDEAAMICKELDGKSWAIV